jgi:predicted transcriptional regulator
MKSKEKKMDKPLSIRLKASTKEAIDKKAHDERRSVSYIIEEAVRKDLNLDTK